MKAAGRTLVVLSPVGNFKLQYQWFTTRGDVGGICKGPLVRSVKLVADIQLEPLRYQIITTSASSGPPFVRIFFGRMGLAYFRVRDRHRQRAIAIV